LAGRCSRASWSRCNRARCALLVGAAWIGMLCGQLPSRTAGFGQRMRYSSAARAATGSVSGTIVIMVRTSLLYTGQLVRFVLVVGLGNQFLHHDGDISGWRPMAQDRLENLKGAAPRLPTERGKSLMGFLGAPTRCKPAAHAESTGKLEWPRSNFGEVVQNETRSLSLGAGHSSLLFWAYFVRF
jgi:hypothetical protein